MELENHFREIQSLTRRFEPESLKRTITPQVQVNLQPLQFTCQQAERQKWYDIQITLDPIRGAVHLCVQVQTNRLDQR